MLNRSHKLETSWLPSTSGCVGGGGISSIRLLERLRVPVDSANNLDENSTWSGSARLRYQVRKAGILPSTGASRRPRPRLQQLAAINQRAAWRADAQPAGALARAPPELREAGLAVLDRPPDVTASEKEMARRAFLDQISSGAGTPSGRSTRRIRSLFILS